MRVGGLPAGQFVAGHRMGADVALPQPGSLDLIADHALDRAHVGERGVRMVAHERGQGGEDCGHRLERIAQHDHIRLGIHEFGERALAENAIGFGLGVGGAGDGSTRRRARRARSGGVRASRRSIRVRRFRLYLPQQFLPCFLGVLPAFRRAIGDVDAALGQHPGVDRRVRAFAAWVDGQGFLPSRRVRRSLPVRCGISAPRGRRQGWR